jgi:hypothetical protein
MPVYPSVFDTRWRSTKAFVSDTGRIQMAAKEGWRGRFFEDFEVGDVYEHPLGRTVTTTDNLWFTLLTQNTAPVLFLFHE